MLRGTGTATFAVLCAAIVRRTLSAIPEGDVWKPWKWMFVGSSRLLTNSSRIQSPGATTIVGPGKLPSYDFPITSSPPISSGPAPTVRVAASSPSRLRSSRGSANAWCSATSNVAPFARAGRPSSSSPPKPRQPPSISAQPNVSATRMSL